MPLLLTRVLIGPRPCRSQHIPSHQGYAGNELGQIRSPNGRQQRHYLPLMCIPLCTLTSAHGLFTGCGYVPSLRLTGAFLSWMHMVPSFAVCPEPRTISVQAPADWGRDMVAQSGTMQHLLHNTFYLARHVSTTLLGSLP